ncbi:hypothetical protein NPIL_234171 [Nephila pilipes]|uniref:Uncharacterized protein n=1 Tax=Nephila pilipes TaxID=299642 RepID=A0A8X6UF53_NEPPI|nr:hypothetical protein NPIL_234171 [Nephila pilipes]
MLEKSLTSLYETKLISKSPKTNRWNSITYPIKQASQPSKGEKVAVEYSTRYGEKIPAVRRKPVSREERKKNGGDRQAVTLPLIDRVLRAAFLETSRIHDLTDGVVCG